MGSNRKKIKIVATSSPAPAVDQEFIDKSKKILEDKGYIVEFGINHHNWSNTSYFHAGTDEERFAELLEAFNDETTDIIWVLRGGYGAAKLLKKLDNETLNKKIVVGFSDVTALGTYLFQKHEIKSIHGPVFTQISKPNFSNANWEKTLDLLEGKKTEIELTSMNDFTSSMRGIALGGNLCVLASLLGTPYQIDTRDRILFLEDTGERGYKVDRLLLQLNLAGKLNNVKAIILGTFTDGNEANGSSLIDSVLENFANQLEIPCFKTNFIGHGEFNYPIVQGGLVDIIETSNGYKLISTL